MSRYVVNLRSGRPYDVYVGRGTPYGNPFTHQPLKNTLAKYQVASREEAVARFEELLLSSPGLQALLPGLRGKVLACHCAPLLCHAEVWARYANGIGLPVRGL